MAVAGDLSDEEKQAMRGSKFAPLPPPPARCPGIASAPSLLPASRSTDSPIRAYRAVALAAATRFSLILLRRSQFILVGQVRWKLRAVEVKLRV